MGVGAASVIAPAYIAEISPARLRGRLGSLQQLAIVTGIFVALLVDYWFTTTAGSASKELWFGLDAWRWMFLSLPVPAVLYGGLALTIPESPRYLVAKGRVKEAATVLRRFVAAQPDDKIAEIQQTLESDHEIALSDLRGPRFGLLPIVWAGILLSVFSVSFPRLSAIGLGLTYAIYAAFALLSLVFVLRAIKETQGKELEEMV
jgi:SP family sugar:H+ symporter-like MFS transporter